MSVLLACVLVSQFPIQSRGEPNGELSLPEQLTPESIIMVLLIERKRDQRENKRNDTVKIEMERVLNEVVRRGMW